ncbi:signal peptidase II [Paracoccus sp. T5]|uniref:signal peptidase II n=1 Tax=Paracoccus sp. T5 TaxID=3402161 RepID=UPI003AE0D81E
MARAPQKGAPKGAAPKASRAAPPRTATPPHAARGHHPDTRPRSGMRLVAWVAAAIFVLDQALKYLVVHVMQLDRLREIDVLPPWLNLRMAWNQGVNFGLLSSEQDVMRWVLVGIAVAICIWVWIWVWRAALGRFARVAAGLLIGGALGNVVDRILYGAVADFLNMSVPGWQNPFSFNVADIAIFAGAIGLVLMPQNKPETTPPARKRGTGTPKVRPAQPKGTAPAKPQEPFLPQARQGDLFDKSQQASRDQARDGDGKPG